MAPGFGAVWSVPSGAAGTWWEAFLQEFRAGKRPAAPAAPGPHLRAGAVARAGSALGAAGSATGTHLQPWKPLPSRNVEWLKWVREAQELPQVSPVSQPKGGRQLLSKR